MPACLHACIANLLRTATQEDEIATNTLTGGVSPYLAIVLPSRWRPLLRRYLAWDDPRDAAAFATWQRAFLAFMRKVCHGRRGRGACLYARSMSVRDLPCRTWGKGARASPLLLPLLLLALLPRLSRHKSTNGDKSHRLPLPLLHAA